MAAIVPNAGEVNLLGVIQASFFNTVNCSFHLFTDNIFPDEDTVSADFTDPTDPLYAPAVVSWTSSALGSGNVAHTISDPALFMGSDPPVDVYGYYFQFDPASAIFFCERFEDAPRSYGLANPIMVKTDFTLRQLGT